MMHKGFEIRRADYPIKAAPSRAGFDILRAEETYMRNVKDIDTAKWVIDKMIKAGQWKDLSGERSAEG